MNTSNTSTTTTTEQVGLGRRIVDGAQRNANGIAAATLVAAGIGTIAYVGGKAALTTAGIIGGGLFAIFAGYEVAKAAVGTANEVVDVTADRVRQSFAKPAGTLHTEKTVEVHTTRRTARNQRGGQRAASAA